MIVKRRIQRAFVYLFVSLIGILMLYPVLWLLSSSLKPEALIFSQQGLWPKEFTLENYARGWYVIQDLSFATFLRIPYC